MSGLEILGAASAILTLLDSATELYKRFHNLYHSREELAVIIDTHTRELASTKAVIEIVEAERALQTAVVASALVEVEIVAKKLVACLKKLGKSGSTLKMMTRHLILGKKEDKTLICIMGELGRAKTNLSLRIQVANVGLTKTLGDSLAVNVQVVERIDRLLQEKFGKEHGLKMANLLKNKRPQGDGMVPLSEADINRLHFQDLSDDENDEDEEDDEEAAFSDEETAVGSEKDSRGALMSRIVIDNLAQEQALQINGPIGEKGWWEVSNLEIRNNKAVGKSVQINHATSMEVFDRILAARTQELMK